MDVLMNVIGAIEVHANMRHVFAISNDVLRWPEIMIGYKRTTIIGRQGHKLWFEILHSNGASWKSWRVVRPDLNFAYAERFKPKEPFQFMHILWTYKEVETNLTAMKWDMEYELANERDPNSEQLHKMLADHTPSNLARMKQFIESS
jgi:ribosome-associated toxin RatA of RatAB toxin-antitoxin module